LLVTPVCATHWGVLAAGEHEPLFNRATFILDSLAISGIPPACISFQMPPFINQNSISCCSTCCCLGYRTAEARTRLKVVSDRSLGDFELSANQKGCSYCAIALQSLSLFKTVVPDMQVDLLLYPNSPTEMHSKSKEGQSEVLEIYPCASKHSPYGLMLLIALNQSRQFNKHRAIMGRSSQRCTAEFLFTSVHTIPAECIPNMHV
jgi:hypothetical protein